MTVLHDFTARRADGRDEALSNYKDMVVLVVNVASYCGFTRQYTGLEALQRQYGADGFTVLGFPCNQFGEQEPGTAAEIASFCELNYDVSFPLFDKVDVNGPAAHPLFRWLRDAAPGLLGFNDIKWNFTKFLIDRQGRAIHRYAPSTEPVELGPVIETALRAPALT